MAHPVAPSHVSALMSGVVIKMGVYGLAARHDRPARGRARVVGRPRPRPGHRLGAPRRALCPDGARSQAAARLSLRREHRHHLHRDRRGPDVPELRADDAGHPRRRRRPVSHDQSRLLQGAAVPGRGVGAARDGHAQHGGDGRADQADAAHRPLLPRRRVRDLGAAAAQRVRLRMAGVPGAARRVGDSSARGRGDHADRRGHARAHQRARRGLLRQGVRDHVPRHPAIAGSRARARGPACPCRSAWPRWR